MYSLSIRIHVPCLFCLSTGNSLTLPFVASHNSTLPVERKKHSEPFSTFITIYTSRSPMRRCNTLPPFSLGTKSGKISCGTIFSTAPFLMYQPTPLALFVCFTAFSAPNISLRIAFTSLSSSPLRLLASGNAPVAKTIPPAR